MTFFVHINPPNCSNPENVKEKIFESKVTGEKFKMIWNDGWDIYELR